MLITFTAARDASVRQANKIYVYIFVLLELIYISHNKLYILERDNVYGNNKAGERE